MARQIFRVDAWIIDANGAYHGIDGYPKNFDSNSYSSAQNPIDTAQRRAEGDFSAIWADMCTKDTRQIQTVTLSTITGTQLDRKTTGQFVQN